MEEVCGAGEVCIADTPCSLDAGGGVNSGCGVAGCGLVVASVSGGSAGPSRVSEFGRDDLVAVLLADDVADRLRQTWPVLALAVPELGALDMDQAGRRLHKDNVAHTIAVTAKTPARLRVRLTALFHDVGKPPTKVVHADGTVTFHQHEVVGAHLTEVVLSRFGFPSCVVDDVVRMVRLSGATKGCGVWSDSAVRRFVGEAGGVLEDLLAFVEVDVTSRHEFRHQMVRDEVAGLRRRVVEVAELDRGRAWRPVIDGAAVMARYGLAPGPEVGRLLAAVSAAQRVAEQAGVSFTVVDAWQVADAAR